MHTQLFYNSQTANKKDTIFNVLIFLYRNVVLLFATALDKTD